jgi:two-component system, sensor histidine kinase LadS
VLMAFTPMIFAAVLLMASSRGWVASSWLSQHILLACFVLEVPLLLVALKRRSRQRHGVEARAQDIASQDALTGLLTKPLFNDRMMQVITRTKRYKEPAAVVYIDLVNYGYIKQTWGTAVAEQSLLRSVIKLRRILRDVDTVGRIEEARFALVLEGSPSRESVTEMGARMIAAGLMPLKGLKPDVLLQFHVVGVLLHERLDTADEIGEKLSELMGSMGTRTRRPIRFLEPELTMPMDLGAQSDFEPESANPKRHQSR